MCVFWQQFPRVFPLYRVGLRAECVWLTVLPTGSGSYERTFFFHAQDALGELWLLTQRFPPEEKEKEVCRRSEVSFHGDASTTFFYILYIDICPIITGSERYIFTTS